MSVLIYGLDTDNPPYWYGWSIPGPGKARGFVDPDYREDFFDELKIAAQSGKLTVRGPTGGGSPAQRTSAYVLDSATGKGWHAYNAPGVPSWQYSGDSPAMSLYVCCANPLTAQPAPEFVTSGSQGNDSPATLIPVQVGEAAIYMLAFLGTDGGTVTDATWHDNIAGGPGGAAGDASPESLSYVTGDHTSVDHDCELWALYDPDLSTDTDSRVGASHPDGRNAGAVLLYRGVNPADPIRTTAIAVGNGGSPSVNVACQPGDLVAVGLSYHGGGTGGDSGPWTAAPSAGWTMRENVIGSLSGTHKAGIAAADIEASGSSVTCTWTLSGGSNGWTAIAVVLRS